MHLQTNCSTLVCLDQSISGDIVFFGTGEAVTHVGLAWSNGEMLEASGGGRKTTPATIARQRHAEVRIRPITRRSDLVEILRPNALACPEDDALEAATVYGHYDSTPAVLEWLPTQPASRVDELLPHCWSAAS